LSSSLDELLAYLEVTDLSSSPPDVLLSLVSAALDTCSEDAAVYPYLVAIEDELGGDRVPLERLRKLVARFPIRNSQEVQDVLDALGMVARSLPESEWATAGYREFIAELERANERERFAQFVQHRRTHLRKTLAEYAVTNIAEHEITAESIAGHKLLCEGLQGWLAALRHVEQGELTEGRASAEAANRLLVAVQNLDGWVQNQAQEQSYTRQVFNKM
jgi:hypothetical protein